MADYDPENDSIDTNSQERHDIVEKEKNLTFVYNGKTYHKATAYTLEIFTDKNSIRKRRVLEWNWKSNKPVVFTQSLDMD